MSICDESTFIHSQVNSGKSGRSVYTFITWVYEKAARYLETRRLHRERRNAFKTLLSLDARALSDIGLNQGDVSWASHLPLCVNASNELQKIRNQK